MSVENFLNNIKTGAEKIVNDRNNRLRDPAFQMEMQNERLETVEALKNAGSKMKEAASDVVLKAILKPAWIALQSSVESKDKKNKITGSHAIAEGFKGFFIAGWSTMKFLGALTVAGIRVGKWAGRYIIAK